MWNSGHNLFDTSKTLIFSDGFSTGRADNAVQCPINTYTENDIHSPAYGSFNPCPEVSLSCQFIQLTNLNSTWVESEHNWEGTVQKLIRKSTYPKSKVIHVMVQISDILHDVNKRHILVIESDVYLQGSDLLWSNSYLRLGSRSQLSYHWDDSRLNPQSWCWRE